MGNFESHSETVLGLDKEKLNIDEAYVYYKCDLNTSRPVYFYSLVDQCVGCDPKLQFDEPVFSEAYDTIDVKYGLDLFASMNSNGKNLTKCSKDGRFLEFGIYNCSVNTLENDQLSCTCMEAEAGANIYLPILCCIAFYLALAISWILGKHFYTKYKDGKCSAVVDASDELQVTTAASTNKQIRVEDAPKSKQRLKSLDTFRGISISVMIFVNYSGGRYWFFDHSVWNGLTVADLVFPWFMWLMGVCIPISMRSLLKRKELKSRAFVKVIKRSLYLFALGLALTNTGEFVDVQKMRIFGVLQRFGITYLIVASLHLAFLKLNRAPTFKKYDFIKDIVDILPQWLIILMLVFIHLMVTMLLQVEDCPRGYLGPGGRSDKGSYVNCTGGVSGYVDRQVLGDRHVYQRSTATDIYDTPLPYDPEGILGTFQACFSVFLGVQAGMILITHKSHKDRIVRWLSWSVVTGVIGAVLCKASKDDGWIPVNKNLWSVTFVLVTSCFAFFILSLCYILIDVKGVWSGAPFFYPGMNSILLYIGHELTTEMFPWRWADSSSGSAVETHGYQLVVNLWGATFWVLISMWLYHIKFFLSI